MSIQNRGELPSQRPAGYRIKVCDHGKMKTVRVHTPASAYARLESEFEGHRSQLIRLAYDVIGDMATAEDIVQSSLANAYYKLNDGKLYAVLRDDRKYILVRGGKHLAHSETLVRMDTRLVNRWRRDGEEVAGIEIIEKPFAWLQAIVQNNAYKYYNQRKKFREFCMDSSNWSLIEDPRCPDPEKEFIRAERCAEVREIVATLPHRYREIVQLRYFQDQEYSFQAIAEKLHRPLHTVTCQSSRALKMIGKAVKALEEGRKVKGGQLRRSQRPAS